MARIELNPAFEAIRGSIGGLVIKRYGNKLVLSQKPVFRNRKFSKAQKKNQEAFGEATRYANNLLRDPEQRKPFEKLAAQSGRTVRGLMIAEYMRANPAK
ncbi:MAG: hypothetical protein KF749_16570 [Bacteroidetes bacterium]|nr:hypothetical protein [Bacteroidota bacterium]MCW5896957.1 hypothetical protein [Bacteroidota bacterium]